MATYVPLHELPIQLQDSVTSDNLSGGTLEFYLAGTSTPTNLFSDNSGTSIGTSITLNSGGFPESGGNVITLWRDVEIAIKIILKNAAGTTVATTDNIPAAEDLRAAPFYPRTQAEIDAGVTPSDLTLEEARANRYGSNTTPGTTDITAAFTDGMSVVENRNASGSGRGELHATYGKYNITSTLSPATEVDIVGEGRWSTRLEFALTAAGTCVDLQGADTNNRLRSTLRKLRIDGTNCTDAAVDGVTLDWNQSQQPILDEVTIYGGYESGGTNTGLRHGLIFNTDGNNWIVSFNELAIEGCHNDQLVMDTADGGAHNAVYFRGGRIENGKERNVVIIGPDDDVNTLQVTLDGMVIEIASFQNTGVNANVHIEGAVIANLHNTYLESGASPNFPTYEVYAPSGRLNVSGCNIAFCNTGYYCGGVVVLDGLNTIRSATAGIHIPNGGRCVINGEVAFLGAGTPITYDAGGVLEWNRDRLSQKQANYTVLTSDYSTVFSNQGAVANITFSLPTAPEGAWLKFQNGGAPVNNSSYRWTLSGSGTTEYYLEAAGGGSPNISQPARFYRAGNERTQGTAGSLANLEWDWADNDSLGFSTIYYRDGGSDPDSFSVNQLMATYTVTIDPTSFRIVPVGSSNGDSIVSDGTLGAFIKLRAVDNAFWVAEESSGDWS